jgi:hypothetical protein
MKHAVRLCLWLLLPAFIALAASARAAQTSSSSTGFAVVAVTDARIDRVAEWVRAIARHAPGKVDEASAAVDSWSNADLQSLWIDLRMLVALTRNPKLSHFELPVDRRRVVRVVYNDEQLARMRALACAAAGALATPPCVALRAATAADGSLLDVARRAGEARANGDSNYMVRRGALLHADIAMAGPLSTGALDTAATLGPQSYLMRTADGQSLDLGSVAIHWDIARMLLDDVRPGGAPRPAPSTDGMVRLWYQATAAWMQKNQRLDLTHLKRAREIFPRDADILFLLGSLHETFAGAQVQSVVRSTVVPSAVVLDVQDERVELRAGEEALRAAIEARPDFPEARLRLGRVVALRGRPAEALAELRAASQSLPPDDITLRYYAELFLGGAEEAAGYYDESRAAYQRAAALFPAAQSPLIGLSELSRRQGDRRSALDAMRRLFALPREEEDRIDPWWTYHIVQARDADLLLEQLWKPFRKTE